MQLLTRETLPDRIPELAALEELLCRPTQALIDELKTIEGDIMVLGVGGKMGPTVAGLARNAAPEKRVIGVARFSEPGLKDTVAKAESHGDRLATVVIDVANEQSVQEAVAKAVETQQDLKQGRYDGEQGSGEPPEPGVDGKSEKEKDEA